MAQNTSVYAISSMVPLVGVEPTRYHYHEILSLARLPIPSQRLIQMPYYYILLFFVCQLFWLKKFLEARILNFA